MHSRYGTLLKRIDSEGDFGCKTVKVYSYEGYIIMEFWHNGNLLYSAHQSAL